MTDRTFKKKLHEAIRLDERKKVLEEVRELIAYSAFGMEGSRPVERNCSVEEAMRQLDQDVAKLNQLKED